MNSQSAPSTCAIRTLPERLLIFAAILMTGLATMTTNCADPDLWGHVQYGREVLHDGVLPRTATWTYAAEGAAWVNHENIAEFLLAWTVDAWGSQGLPWMKLSIAAMLLTLMIVSAGKSGAGWLATGIFVTLVAACIQFHWHFRPQILTYLSLAAMLAVWQFVFGEIRLDNETSAEETISFTNRRVNWLWVMPLLMCFWANSHGGFAAGVAIMCAYHGLICLQLVWQTGLKHSRLLIVISVVTVSSVLATLVNPYGIGLWEFMLAALKLPRPEIADWSPLPLFNSEAIRFWGLLTAVVISLSVQRSRLQSAQVVVLGLLLWQGLSHCRHFSIFAIVCGFWIPRHLQAVVDAFRSTMGRLQPDRVTGGNGSMVTLITSGLILLCSQKLSPLLCEVPVERNEYPVSAMQYLQDKNLHGKVLVTFNWAQYAIGCFAAGDESMRQSRVAVDGRFETCYPREITDICFDFWFGTSDPAQRYRSPQAPPFDPSRALEFKKPDLVLLSRSQGPSLRMMQQHTNDWVLLYQDSIAQIWGRGSKYANSSSPYFLPAAERRVTEMPQIGTVPWPAFPAYESPSERFTSREISPLHANAF
jgi:hypothetical protein